jgi:hypothetical protein
MPPPRIWVVTAAELLLGTGSGVRLNTEAFSCRLEPGAPSTFTVSAKLADPLAGIEPIKELIEPVAPEPGVASNPGPVSDAKLVPAGVAVESVTPVVGLGPKLRTTIV